MAVINVDLANGFAFLDGEEDDEVIMAAARARFEAEKVRVKAEKAAEKAWLEAEKSREEAEARRWNYCRNYSRQPYNAGAGYYSDNRSYGSNGNRSVNSESGSHSQVYRGYNGDGGNNQRYHGLVYNGYHSNESSSHALQEGNGGINHNRRDVVRQWVPRNAVPQDFVSDENQQVVDVEKKTHSVESECVNKEKKVVVVEEDYRELMTLEEYEKSLLTKKGKMVSLKGGVDCRKVTIDKDLQSMKPLGKKIEDKQLKTDQKASQNKEEKKTGLKVQKASQNIVTQKIGLKFKYKPPVERREYNNDRGGQNMEGDRPNTDRQGDVNTRPNGAVGRNNGNNGEVPPNGCDRRQHVDARTNGDGNAKPNGGNRRQHVDARTNSDGNARPNVAIGRNNGNNSEVLPNGCDRWQHVDAGTNGDGNARPNAAVARNNVNNSGGRPNSGDRRQYVGAGRGKVSYDRPNACRGQGAGYYANVRPNCANARERRQEAGGNIAPVKEANNMKVVDGESANVASRGPTLLLPRVEDPVQFPSLVSKVHALGSTSV